MTDDPSIGATEMRDRAAVSGDSGATASAPSSAAAAVAAEVVPRVKVSLDGLKATVTMHLGAKIAPDNRFEPAEAGVSASVEVPMGVPMGVERAVARLNDILRKALPGALEGAVEGQREASWNLQHRDDGLPE